MKISVLFGKMKEDTSVITLLVAIFGIVLTVGGFVVKITNQISKHTVQIETLIEVSKDNKDQVMKMSEELSRVSSQHEFMVLKMQQIGEKLNIGNLPQQSPHSWPEWKDQPDAKKVNPNPFGPKSLLDPKIPDLGFLKVPPPPQKLMATE